MFAQLTAPGPSPWVKITAGGFAVQITAPTQGAAAASVSAVVQRSTQLPQASGAGGNPAPVWSVTAGVPGQLEPQYFEEPASVGYWRLVVTDLIGGGVAVSIDGEQI